MGKRSDFARRPMDDYQTIDDRAGKALLPFVKGMTYAEPCCGEMHLVLVLEALGLRCSYAGDIKTGEDALVINDFGDADAIITNPPWTRSILHPMIRHFQKIAPTWLLFDADWAHNRHAAPYLDQCSHIVAVGRLIWMPGTKQSGKDNVCWYRFDSQHQGGPRFYARQIAEAE